MLHLIGQTYPTTLPITEAPLPAWATAILAILAALGTVLGALAILLPHVRAIIKDLRDAIGGAHQTAAQAVGYATATQQVANARAESTERVVVDLAHKMNPPPEPRP
jgi:hypothetical protein